MLTKPRARRAEMITPEEHDCAVWLGRLAMALAVVSHDLPEHWQRFARGTVDEFLASGCSSETLAAMVRDEVKRP